MLYRHRRSLLLFAGLLILLGSVEAWSARIPKWLPLQYQDWLRDVDVLISRAERKAFLKLEKDYQRDAFIERFWQARDPYPETQRNEYRDQYQGRLASARELWGSCPVSSHRRIASARAPVWSSTGPDTVPHARRGPDP